MKVFHYTHLPRCETILHTEPTGLIPPEYKMPLDDDNLNITFGLLDPMPKNWIDNPYFKDMWETLRSHIGSVLLEIEVDPESEYAFVMDRGHYAGHDFLCDQPTDIPSRYIHKTEEDALRAYIKSMVSLKSYTDDPSKFQYALPEVALTEHIPIERIRIPENQPLIGDSLAFDMTFDGSTPKAKPCDERLRQAEYYAKKIPELKGWIKGYRDRFADYIAIPPGSEPRRKI